MAVIALRKRLEEAGLSQAELARRTGLKQGYISQLANGERANPTLNALQRIADELGVPVSALIEEDARCA